MKSFKNNSEFLKHIMEYSEYGVLKEAFIMTCLLAYSKTVIDTDAPGPFSHLLAPGLWKEVASELLSDLQSYEDQDSNHQTNIQ